MNHPQLGLAVKLSDVEEILADCERKIKAARDALSALSIEAGHTDLEKAMTACAKRALNELGDNDDGR